MPEPRLPLPVRLILRALPRDDRRIVEGDLVELSAEISTLRLIGEALSAASHSLIDRFSTRPSVRPNRPRSRVVTPFFNEIRLAIRSFSRQPGFALAAIVLMALGIGATSAVFSVANGVLFRPLPFRDADRIVTVWQYDRLTGTTRESSGPGDYWDYVDRTSSYEGVAAINGNTSTNFSRDGAEPRNVQVAFVTAGTFEVLGIGPIVGRAISEQDVQDAANVILLERGFWVSQFGADSSIVGRSVDLDGVASTVIGVFDGGNSFPFFRTNVIAPLQINTDRQQRSPHAYNVVARLAEGVSPAAADAEMRELAVALEAEYAGNRGRGIYVEPLREFLSGDARTPLVIVLGAVVLVLLIASANVANLLLARGAGRSREIALCTALGAGRGSLLRRFAAEALVLAGAATAAGVLIGIAGTRALISLAPAALSEYAQVTLDAPVALVTLGTMTGVAFLFSLIPLWQTRRLDMHEALKEGGGRAGTATKFWHRKSVVAAQVALAFVLLTGAGLLFQSFRSLHNTDPGFNPQGILRASFRLPQARYPRQFSSFPDWPETRRFVTQLLDRLRAAPGVSNAAIAMNHPLDPGFTNSFVITGREAEYEEQGELVTRLVSRDYFETVGMSIVAGRPFDVTDTHETDHVLILNEAAVRRYFPDADPIGTEITYWGIPRTVIGIVTDAKTNGLAEPSPPTMYSPIPQMLAFGKQVVLLRTAGDPTALVSVLRDAIWTLDPEVAVYDIDTMTATLAESLARERFMTYTLAVFAAVALAISVLGLYSVLSYLISLRSHEIGVRTALGAASSDVVRFVLTQGMTPVLVGLVVGAGVAAVAARAITGVLFETSPANLVGWGGAAASIVIAALAACTVPARRAVAVDPVQALRSE